uniref:Uncharacterized protein n=1 Tax=Oryzias latipes TaxID=8090 RepID=A0A3P9KS30_ORYLA
NSWTRPCQGPPPLLFMLLPIFSESLWGFFSKSIHAGNAVMCISTEQKYVGVTLAFILSGHDWSAHRNKAPSPARKHEASPAALLRNMLHTGGAGDQSFLWSATPSIINCSDAPRLDQQSV